MSDTIATAVSENRITFATWTQLRSPEGAPIQAGENPVLSVSAVFLRTINPLQYSRAFATVERDASAYASGVRPRFESPEHEGMASNVTLQLGPDVVVESNYRMMLSNSFQVSYQQTIALAGDFYGVPDSPISDGATLADRKTRFLAAFNTLDTGDPSQIRAILIVMALQATAVENLVTSLSGSDRYSQAFTKVNSGHYFDKQYNEASGGSGGTTWLLDKGTYLELAATNWDHFGSHAVAAYTAGHSAAIDQALAAAAESDPATQPLALQRAYLMEAFCAHFLADLFSTGHLRTPRKALHDGSGFPDLLTQDMHDEDSYNGLMVSSVANTTPWLAYGDKRMMDPDNATNLEVAQEALQASADEIYAAFSSRTAPDPSTYAALQMIPSLYPLFDAQKKANWSPLFIAGGDQSAQLADAVSDPDGCSVRFFAGDLTERNWDQIGIMKWFYSGGSTDLCSLAIWVLIPGGGYHSLEGAPPARIAQLDQLAHSFNWSSSYALPDDLGSPIANTMAPCAVLTANTSTHDDDLSVFFTFSNAVTGNNNIWQVTAPMSTVSSRSFATGSPHKTWVPYQTNGHPATLSLGETILLVFPATDGSLWQAVISPSDGSNGPAAGAVFGSQSSSYKMNAQGRVALAASASGVFLAYRGSDTNLYWASGTLQQKGITWGLPTAVSVGGKKVPVASDPTLVVIDDDLYLSVAFSIAELPAATNNEDPILIYQLPAGGSWNLFLNGIHDSSPKAINVRSFAQIFAYSDGYAVVGTDPNAGNIQTYVPQRNYYPQRAWVKSDVKVAPLPTLQLTTVKTNYPVSVVFYQGNPYIIYSDSKTNALSVISAVPIATTQG